MLPKPEPTTRPETYSVVVNNVDVHDLLFALARDAKVNVDIEPGITGKVTLNAIDQTLPQLLTRISRQVDMRYELHGPDLVVMRDTPYLRVYRVDYVNLDRNATMKVAVSSQLAGGTTGAGVVGQQRTDELVVVARDDLEQQVLGNADRQHQGHPARNRQGDPDHRIGAGRPAAARARGHAAAGRRRDAERVARRRPPLRSPSSRKRR